VPGAHGPKAPAASKQSTASPSAADGSPGTITRPESSTDIAGVLSCLCTWKLEPGAGVTTTCATDVAAMASRPRLLDSRANLRGIGRCVFVLMATSERRIGRNNGCETRERHAALTN
jgi:hypothetical protein